MPDAAAAQIFMDTVYTPVMSPIRSGNFPLINPGSSTLQTAMDKPIIVVPANSIAVPEPERIRMPMDKASMASMRTLAVPNRRASCGAKGDKSAKASSGKVVMNPASVLVNPRSSRISSSSGPTEVNGARSAAATSTMPSTSSSPFELLWGWGTPDFPAFRSCGLADMMFLPVAAQIPDKPGLVRDYCQFGSTHIVLL
ncbi:hypothetical protein D3C81_1447830 [compost metagenome]